MKLNDRITIQKSNNDLVDEDGFNIDGWTDYHKCWSGFKTVGWKDYFSAKSIKEENIVTFTVRYSPKIKAMIEDLEPTKNYRLKYKSKLYDIKYINDLGNNHEYIDIKAEIIL